MILKLGQANFEESRSIGNPNNGEDTVNHGKSGGSLRSQSGNLKEGPVGIGESEGSQGSGQNGNQTNENIYESLSLPGNSGHDKELNEDAISHGHPGGN